MLKKVTGFTLVELLIVVAVIAIIGIVTYINLQGGSNQTIVISTAQQATALLREAQVASASQKNDTAWGIYFSNLNSTDPFYALISSSTYSSSTVVATYRLSSNVAYLTSTLAMGSSTIIAFSPISGNSSVSTTISIYAVEQPSIIGNISVTGLGKVSYNLGALGSFSNPSPSSSQVIWVTDTSNNRVEKFSASGTYKSQLGCSSGGCSSSSGNGKFVSAGGVAVDQNGNIWVTDSYNNRVEKFNSSGTYKSQLGCSNGQCPAVSTNGDFNEPVDIAIDQSGNMWVVDFGNNRVEKLNSAGVYQSQIGICTTGACIATSTNGGFNTPGTVAIDGSGNIWVTDTSNNRVEKFNSSGVYQSQLGCGGSGGCGNSTANGYFQYPGSVAIDGSGNVWVVDNENNRVEKFNSSDVYQSQIGICPTGSCNGTSTNGGFIEPTHIAIDQNGNIWVVDSFNNRIEEFNSAGVYQSQIGICTTGACIATTTSGGFYGPESITIY